jgi:thiamine biosynthesis protein ThiS
MLVDGKEREVAPGNKLSHLVEIIEDERKQDAMIRALIEKTGKSSLTYVFNGRVIKPKDYDKIEIREGDRLDVVHPVFGG